MWRGGWLNRIVRLAETARARYGHQTLLISGVLAVARPCPAAIEAERIILGLRPTDIECRAHPHRRNSEKEEFASQPPKATS